MNVGRIEVTPIIDAEGSFATVDQVFSPVGPHLKADAAARFPANFRGDDWWLPMQVALIRAPEAVILVDTGLGPPPREFVPQAPVHLLEQLEALELSPEAVDLVIHTHLHIDHVGWNGGFPNARYMVHEDDLAHFSTPRSLEERPHIREKILPLRDGGLIDPIAGPAEPVPGVRVVPTPGHTPGHVSVWVESDDDALVILGDVIVHPLQLLDPRVRYVSDHDHELTSRTRRSILDGLAEDKTPALVPHLYGVGRFVHAGDGWDWSPIA